MSRYHMRNKDKEIAEEEKIVTILEKGKFMTFALCNGSNPYIVTLSYGYDRENEAIYMHCANHGMKIDYIQNNPKACATVIENHGYKARECSQFYRSLVIWGKLSLVTDLEEKKHAFSILFKHLEGENQEMVKQMASDEEAYHGVGVLRFDIAEIDAKGNV